VEVPADCGILGKQCCPSTYNMITDKPVPAAAWGGDACDPKGAKYGTFCQGGCGRLQESFKRAYMLAIAFRVALFWIACMHACTHEC